MYLTRRYSKYYSEIEKKINKDGYIPKTDVKNLAIMVCLHFDCEEHDDEFTADDIFQFVEWSGGWESFDYYC